MFKKSILGLLMAGMVIYATESHAASPASPPTSKAITEGVTSLNSDNFDDFISDGLVIVDFYADWCGPCRMMAPLYASAAEIFRGKVKFGKLNTDKAKSVSRSQRIDSLPTLIIYRDGREVTRHIGGLSKSELERFIKSAL